MATPPGSTSPTLFEQWCGFFYVPQCKNKMVKDKVLWDGTNGFSSLSEKTRKSNRLQMSLLGQHFLLSSSSVGPARVWTCDLPLSRPVSAPEVRSNDSTTTSLKKWICVPSVLIAIIPTHLLCQKLAILLELNSKGLYPSSEREIKFRRSLFTFSIKREIRHFHVVVVRKR